jgi:hypothetical protein
MKSLADPARLKPLKKQDGLLQVIIETPADSRIKFAFDPWSKPDPSGEEVQLIENWIVSASGGLQSRAHPSRNGDT